MSDEKPPANNIIVFPKASKIDPGTVEEIKRVALINKKIYCDEVSANIAEEVFGMLARAGIDVRDERFIKDNILLVEAIESVMLKFMGVDHKLQQVADMIIEVPEDMDIPLFELPEEDE